MTYRSAFASVLAISAVLAGGAYAADQTMAPAQPTPAQAAADKDAGKLSVDGAAAFRDLHMTRIAIFEADPAQAKTLIGKAQAELAKAKTDDTVFTKAEADLKAPAKANGKSTTTASTDADAKTPIQWIPVDGQLTLGDDFVATPQKTAAVSDANKSLSSGDRKGALEKLKLAEINVDFTLAVLPLVKTTNDVDQAATLINDGKYYEANAMLKQAEDGIRFDMVDVNGTPEGQKAAAAAPAATSAMKPAKQTTN